MLKHAQENAIDNKHVTVLVRDLKAACKIMRLKHTIFPNLKRKRKEDSTFEDEDGESIGSAHDNKDDDAKGGASDVSMVV